MHAPRNIVIAALLCAASLAVADVVPIPEFTGSLSEGFENIYPPGGYPGPIPIFGGAATMDDTLAHTVVIAYVWQGPAGQVFPYDGNLFGGTVAGSTMFTFPTPVQEFGGFLNSIGPVPGGNVVFRDALGGEIATLPVTITPGQWAWQGWRSDVPIGSIEVIGAGVPGFSTLYDDLQANVPEPATLTLVLAAAGWLLRRR